MVRQLSNRWSTQATGGQRRLVILQRFRDIFSSEFICEAVNDFWEQFPSRGQGAAAFVQWLHRTVRYAVSERRVDGRQTQH